MAPDVELSSLDLRYEGHRMRDPAREVRLLVSIQERGVENPLYRERGIDIPPPRLAHRQAFPFATNGSDSNLRTKAPDA